MQNAHYMPFSSVDLQKKVKFVRNNYTSRQEYNEHVSGINIVDHNSKNNS